MTRGARGETIARPTPTYQDQTARDQAIRGTFAFRRAAQGVIDFNAGALASAGWRRGALDMTEQVIRELRSSLHEVDSLLADLVDPGRRVFSREELIRDHGFTDVGLLDLDREWM